jgi:hypothetical protein
VQKGEARCEPYNYEKQQSDNILEGHVFHVINWCHVSFVSGRNDHRRPLVQLSGPTERVDFEERRKELWHERTCCRLEKRGESHREGREGERER